MKRIEKLTPEQESLMPICRDFWIKKGLQTGETDWETAEKNIKLAYQKAKLKAPSIVIKVNSPLVGALTASILDAYFKSKDKSGAVHDAVRTTVSNAVDNAVRIAVGDAVRGAVGSAVRGAVGDAVRDAVDGAVDGAVHDAVRGAVGTTVSNAVRDAVGDAVCGAVGDAVCGAVRVAVCDAVDDAVRIAVDDVRNAVGGKNIKWHGWLGGQFWVGGWYYGNAYSSYFIDYCKLEVSDDIRERYEIYKNINSSCNYIWLNTNFIIMCARPSKIELSNNRLHCIDGKSIEYPDEWGLYHLYGVKFEEGLYNKVISKQLTFEEWSKETNEEVKSAILSFFEDNFGGEYVYRFLSKYIKEVDTYIDKKDSQYMKGVVKSMNIGVYTLFKGKINKIEIAYVRCYCPSTDRMFFLGVHPDMTNAKDAIASLCQLPVKLKPHLKSISRQGEIFSFNFTEKGTNILKNKQLTTDDYSDVESLTGNEYFNNLKFEY